MWFKAEKASPVAKGLSGHLFGFPFEEIDRLVNSQKVASVAHPRRSSQGSQPQDEDAQLIGLPLDVQSQTGM